MLHLRCLAHSVDSDRPSGAAHSSHDRPLGRRLARAFLLCAALAPLAGCGGGGGGGGGAAPPAAPAGLDYLAPSAFTVGLAIAPLSPTLSAGDAPTFTVAPPLPAGLALDPNTGTISGTPIAPSPATVHQVTATNATGTSTFDLTIEVLAAAVPTIAFPGGDLTVSESAGLVDVTVSLSQPTTVPVSFTVAALSPTATAGVDHDFTAPLPVTIAAGATTATVSVTLLDDAIDEPDETLPLRIESPVGGVIATPDTMTLTIVDDDATPLASFTTATITTSEIGGSFSVELALDRPASDDRTLALTATGDATAPGDFVAIPSTVDFPAGSTTAQLTLTPVDDTVFEGDESLTLTLVAGSDLSPGAIPAVTIELLEDDLPPTVELSGGGVTIIEGDPPYDLTVSLSAIADVTVAVDVAVTGTATAGVDHALTATTLTFLPGTVTQILTIDPISDGTVESPETVIVTLTAATPATLGAVTEAVVTIEDSPIPPPTVEVTGGGTILEGAGLVNIDVVLSALSPVPVSIDYDLSGTATAGVDFAPPANPVIIPAGALTASITIEPIDDGITEGAETVEVTLLGATGATLGSNLSASVTIDEPPIPTVTLGSGGTVLENAAPFTIAVTLSVPAPDDVLVDFNVTGTATNAVDYAVSNAPLTIPAGSTVTTITIDPLTDTLVEGSESVVVTLTQVSGGGAVLGAGFTATVLIEDPVIPTVGLSGSGQTSAEGGSPMTIAVELSAPTNVDVIVDFAFSGTAAPGTDFLPTGSPVAIIAGTTATSISIQPLADGAVEGNETVIVQILTANGATVGAAGSAQVTILDDTTAPVAPAGLTYSESSVVYLPGVTITPNVPTLATGSADTWSSVPILPFGLNLDPMTGVITGSPLIDQPTANYTITAANAFGQATATIEIAIGTSFELDMPSLFVPYDPSNGAAQFSLSLTVEEQVGSASNPVFSPIHGISAGILYDESEVILLSVGLGDAVAGFDGGNGPEFFVTTAIPGGGMTFGMVISFSQNEFLVGDGPQEWAALDFVPESNFLVGDFDGATATISWNGNLGSPPIGTLVVYGTQQSIAPDLDDAVIEFVP